MKLFIATPCHGGLVTRHYMLSLLQLNDALVREKIPYTLATIGNESLITRARNHLAAEFLEEADATHLLFIDADIQFGPEAVFRLLSHGGKVVAGACPKKKIAWQSMQRNAAKCGSSTDLKAASMEYYFNVDDHSEALPHERFDRRVVDGFVKAAYVGTGFMLIHREALLAIRARFPELSYRDESPGNSQPRTLRPTFGFFDTLVHPVSQRFLSEDYAFCQRWRSCGGEIWVDVQSRLGHEGRYVFEGNASRLMEKLGGEGR